MKAELVKTPKTTEKVSSHGVKKCVARNKKHRNTPVCQRKTEGAHLDTAPIMGGERFLGRTTITTPTKGNR
jgi:hypothetical protein